MFVLPSPAPPRRSVRRSAVTPAFGGALDRLFDESLRPLLRRQHAWRRHPRALDGRGAKATPAYTIVFDVPGTTREQLKVSVGRQARRPEHRCRERSRCAGRRRGSARRRRQARPSACSIASAPPAAYARTVVLPAEVDQAQSQAKFENGVADADAREEGCPQAPRS